MNDPSDAPAELADAVVVITGTTRGLGAALLDAAVTAGAVVVAANRPQADGSHTDRSHAERSTTTHTNVEWDDHRAAGKVIEIARRRAHTERRWLGVIHSAGTLGHIGPLGTLDAADIATTTHINLTVALQLTDAAARASRHLPRLTRVLLVSSGAARKPYEGWGPYCASKAGLDHLARCAAAETAVRRDADPTQLIVHSLAPGVVDTDMQTTIRATPTDRFAQRERFVELHRQGGLLPPAIAAARLLERWLDPITPTVDG